MCSAYYKVTCRRWFWGCAAAAAVCIAIMAVPAPCSAAGSSSCGQPVAARLWNTMFGRPASPQAIPVTVPVPVPQPTAAAHPAAVPPPAAKPAPRPAVPLKTAASNFKETGSTTAPILCEIYSDYQCPSCAMAYRDIVPLLVEQYVRTGKVRLRHRDFPLRQHAYSRIAARYANAAGRVGMYDLVVNQLFRTQNQWGTTGNIEADLSQVLSAPVLRQVQGLLKDPTFDDTVDADLMMALQDHIDRTPSIVVVSHDKRVVIAEVPTFPLLKGYLDELLVK